MTSAAAVSGIKTWTMRGARCLGIAWLAIFGLVYFGQNKLLYVPFGGELTPESIGLKTVTAERFATVDGESLVAWTAVAKPGKPTLVVYHGNGGNLRHRAYRIEKFVAEGWGVFAFSYRGFSGSTGSPGETAIISDALLAYDTVAKRGVSATDIVLYGESLGTGVAVQVAAQRPVAAVILEAPYSSIVDVAANRFWYLPVSATINDRYESTQHIKRVTAPVLIMHGTKDGVIPVRLAHRLRDATPGPKRFVEYPDGGHVDLYAHGAFDAIKAWVVAHHRPVPAVAEAKREVALQR